MKIEMHGEVVFSQENITVRDFRFDGGGEKLKEGQTPQSVALSCALDWVEKRIAEMRQEIERAEFEYATLLKSSSSAWLEVSE